jgi:hypothetical protein
LLLLFFFASTYVTSRRKVGADIQTRDLPVKLGNLDDALDRLANPTQQILLLHMKSMDLQSYKQQTFAAHFIFASETTGTTWHSITLVKPLGKAVFIGRTQRT